MSNLPLIIISRIHCSEFAFVELLKKLMSKFPHSTSKFPQTREGQHKLSYTRIKTLRYYGI